MRAWLITREVITTHIYKQSPWLVNIHLDQWIYVLSFSKHFGEMILLPLYDHSSKWKA